MGKAVEPVFPASSPQIVHGMLPGSHERGGGAECRCGSQWDRWNDVCVKQAQETEEFRALNFSTTVGANEDYLAVENNFSSVDFSIVEQQEVQNTVTISIEELRKLIPMLQIIVDSADKFGRR
jgi:hypothetical protein